MLFRAKFALGFASSAAMIPQHEFKFYHKNVIHNFYFFSPHYVVLHTFAYYGSVTVPHASRLEQGLQHSLPPSFLRLTHAYAVILGSCITFLFSHYSHHHLHDRTEN